MSNGWTVEKKKAPPRKKREWVADLGLVLLYSLFMTGCFFIFITPRVWAYPKLSSWVDLASIFLVVLASPFVSFVLHNLRRTLLIFALSSLVGFGLASISSVAFLFRSYTYFEIEIAPDVTRAFSPAQQILIFTLSFLFVSILGAIAGDFVAEKTRKGETTLTLRCSKCGTWNAQDTIYCSHCGSNLHGEYSTADKRMRSRLET